MTYIATIKHHSLAAAPCITIHGNLAAAKRAATDRFGDGFIDHTSVIYQRGEIVALRMIGSRNWQHAAH